LCPAPLSPVAFIASLLLCRSYKFWLILLFYVLNIYIYILDIYFVSSTSLGRKQRQRLTTAAWSRNRKPASKTLKRVCFWAKTKKRASFQEHRLYGDCVGVCICVWCPFVWVCLQVFAGARMTCDYLWALASNCRLAVDIGPHVSISWPSEHKKRRPLFSPRPIGGEGVDCGPSSWPETGHFTTQ